jgi:phosphoglycerate dehydrogenase-like enzyme
MPEVMDLVTYCEFMRDQVAHVQVDKDRSVREASARALDCAAHGEMIQILESQVGHFDKAHQHADGGRVALLGLLFALDQLLESPRADLTVAQLLAALRDASKKTHAAHDRAWKR